MPVSKNRRKPRKKNKDEGTAVEFGALDRTVITNAAIISTICKRRLYSRVNTRPRY